MMISATRSLIQLFKKVEPNTHIIAGSILELARIPAITLSGPNPQEVKQLRKDAVRLVVRDAENSTAIREICPRWYNLFFFVTLSCKSQIELMTVLANCSRLTQQHPLLTANREDDLRERQYSWGWRKFPAPVGGANISEVFEASGELTIHDVEVYSDIRDEVQLIKRIVIETPSETLEIKKGVDSVG